jgi:hypothetical protein
MVLHACHPRIWEANAGGTQIQSQPELYNQTMYQKIKVLNWRCDSSHRAPDLHEALSSTSVPYPPPKKTQGFGI